MNDNWPKEEHDEIDFGDTGWVSTKDGFINKRTEERMDSEGRVYDKFGELISDPNEDD